MYKISIGDKQMSRKIFWTIIVIIITITNVALFNNYYQAELKNNKKIIKQI